MKQVGVVETPHNLYSEVPSHIIHYYDQDGRQCLLFNDLLTCEDWCQW
jgi:hypothetical protein